MAHSQTSSPTSFNRSPLVQLLSGLQSPDTVASTQTLAERLGHWVGWKDAIGLSCALDAHPVARPSVEPPSDAVIAGVIALVEQVRGELVVAITHDPLLADDTPAAQPPRAVASSGISTGDAPPAADFASYRHSYLTHQRAMDERIGQLRADVRAVVAGASAALARLAALDAAMDQALAAHQRRVVGQVPALLERHFQRQRPSRAQPLATTHGSFFPTRRHGPQPAVGSTVQQALLAELALRLQPVMGMIEALGAHAARNA